ncbi:MAG: SGNH/GDSL hydrolase family protein [Anaerolineales bacterium]
MLRLHTIPLALICTMLLAGCAAAPSALPQANPSSTPSSIPTLTPLPTLTPTPTTPPIPSPTPTERPLTLAFYGDSLLKVGDASRADSVGFSIVDVLRSQVNSADQIIVSNHGGRNAEWGYQNLQMYILNDKPDVVTLWWGLNDLDGCPGIFDRATKQIIQYKLAALLNQHLTYMTMQINALLAAGIPVIVITPIPVLGTLPWSHFGPDNSLVWENDTRCDFNLGLEQLVAAQRTLVAGFKAVQKPVYLVDAWQVYQDHPNTADMYMDIVHPGAQGAQLIAQQWLEVFNTMR